MLIAKYTCNTSGVVPTFNNGYVYEVNEIENNGIYTVEITSESDFSKCTFSNILTVEYLKVTSNVTNMEAMFYNCSNLTSLDLSNFDTGKVTVMNYMFYNCSNLTSLDVSNFDTSNVKNMSNMFNGCSNLTSLDLSNFNTSNVTDMNNMFRNCRNLTSLDVSNFDTGNVGSMTSMFYGCSNLTSLDLSNFNTSNVTDIGNIFFGCKSLTSLDLSKWNTSKVVAMQDMFNSCTNLTLLDLSSFNTSKVTAMNGMFVDCKSLTSLDLSIFDTSKVTTTNNMFSGCFNLTSIGLIYANIDTISKLPTPSISTLYIDTNIDQTAYTGSSKLKVYEQRTATINIPTALRSNKETADRIYWDDTDKHYYIEQNINPNTNETLETPNIIASGVKQPIYLKIYENVLSVGIQNIQPSYMSINVPFFEIPDDHEYKWEDELDYIKQSFELRFPDEDDVEEGWGFMGVGEEGTGLKALIDWVDKCTDEEFVRDFDQHFHRDYTLRYFLLVITLGMVDNLGKNMMLDTWDNKIYMPRFYDCDTICSYDNSGQLKFDVDIEMSQGYWNTSSSRLWTRIRDLMHDELVAKYNNMRQNGLSYESLMECFYDEQIAKIPQKYYNMDYDIKYAPFADSYIGMANGDVYEHVKRWLQQRLRFVDTLYDYAPSYNNDVLTIRANTTEPMTLEIETYTPVYQHLSWYNNQMDKKKIDGKTSVFFTGTAMAATDQEVLIYGGSNIKSIKGITSMNPNRMLIGSATRLIELDAPNCPLLADINANKANLAPHIYLNKVNLSGCPLLGGNLIVNQSPLIREIDIRNTAITGLNLSSNLRNLEVLRLPSTIPNLVLNDAGQLHTLEFDAGGTPQSVSMTNCNALINVTNFNLEDATSVILNNSYNTAKEFYFSKTANLSISNMPNLERIIYTPNAEHEVFDKVNVDNAQNYTVSTFNCPKLDEFITTAPYRTSYGKEYGEVKPNEVFEANVLDISSTQFKDVKLLCTTDANKLLLPKTVKNLIIDSAYDLDTEYLTDGDYDTIHTELYEPYNTDYEDEVVVSKVISIPMIADERATEFAVYGIELYPKGYDTSNPVYICSQYIEVRPGTEISYTCNSEPIETQCAYYDSNKNPIYFTYHRQLSAQTGWKTAPSNARYVRLSFRWENITDFSINVNGFVTPNLLPSASDGSLIFSMYAPQNTTEPTSGVWDMKGIGFNTFHTFGLNNDVKLVNDTLSMPNRTDNYSNSIENVTFNGTVAVYTASDANTFPVFNEGFEYKSIVLKRGDDYQYTLIAKDKEELPTQISFGDRGNLLTVEYLNTSNVTNMYQMFYNCQLLTSLDLSSFNTSNVTSMQNMFDSCKSLTSLDVSNFDTSEVTSMSSMFNGCTNLTSLDVSNFDTSNVTAMSWMFTNCSKLTSLDVSNFDTSNVTAMNSMFRSCSNLTTLDVSNFDTSNVINMASMFYDYKSLTSLDLSSWDTSQVTNMRDMFNGCTNLTSLNVSNFDTSKVTDMRWMFYNCKSLTSLNVSNFDTSKVTNMEAMFYNCKSLTSLNVSNFDTSKVTDTGWMFDGCTLLQELNIESWILNNKTQSAIDSLPIGDDAKNVIYASVNFTVPSGWTLINATAKTMLMDKNDLANLTDEEIAVLINDGWTIG